jgi:transcriptional regulator with XRE-family HTH domain
MSPTVTCVPASWPVEDFREYVRALMDAAGIPDYAELSRLTGVSQTQFSNWRRGNSQPSRLALKKIYRALGLKSPVPLYIAAGLDTHEELELEDQPSLAVLPKPLAELLEVFEQMRALGLEDMALSSIRVVVAGLRAQLPDTRKGQPSGQRRKAG